MTDYNKIITTVNSITPDYQFIPDLNNTIVIDTSENRIGINTITPDENIHVSGGTIKTQNLTVLGDFSVNNVSSDILPRDDLSYNIGSITHRWNDLFIGSGTMYMDKTRILRMGDYTRHGANDISALIIDNSGKHLDISDIRHVNIEGDVSINKHVDIKEQLTVLSDVSFMSKFYIEHDTSFNNHVDIKEQLTVLSDVSFMSKFVVIDDSSFNSDVDVSGVLHIKQSLTADGLVTTGTKIYTIYENNSAGNPTTRLIIDPSGDGIPGSVAEQGEVVIMGNLDVKGTSTFIRSTNVDISDNIIRMNANHNAVTDGGIAVKNSSNVDKLFTYNNPGNYWTTNDTNINLGPNGGVVTSGFMNIDNINIDGNTIDVDSGDLVLKSDTGQVVVENVTFNSNTISTNNSLDLNLTAAGGDIYTQNTNLDLGTGVLTVNSVVRAHVPTGAIIIWYGSSGNVPTGWAICDGTNGTPNLSGRFVVCSGTSEQTYGAGQSGGTDFPTLTTGQMPSHSHGNTCSHTDPQHTHANQVSSETVTMQGGVGGATPGLTQVGDKQHAHGGTSHGGGSHAGATGGWTTYADVAHTHPNQVTQNDVRHAHPDATAVQTNVDHNHTANTSQSTIIMGQTDVDHSHWDGQHTHTLPQHTHQSTAHTHSCGSHNHTTNIGQHTHDGSIAFSASSSEGSDGTASILTDDQSQYTVNAANTLDYFQFTAFSAGGGNFGSSTANVNAGSGGGGQPTTVASNSDPTGLSQLGITGVTVQENETRHNHGLTMNLSTQIGNAQPVAQASINHGHNVPIPQSAVNDLNHNHTVAIQNETQPHKHLVAMDQIAHDHGVQIQQHNHTVTIQQSASNALNHNHSVSIQNTGGGGTHDNRPKWYSLYYIMKL